MKKNLVTLMLVTALILPSLASQAAALKIGVVNTRELLNSSAEWKRAQERIKRKLRDLGRPLQRRREDISRQLAEFEKQATVMKEEARKRKQEEIQRKIRELQRQAAEADRAIARFEEQEKGPILKKLQQAVETVAREEGLDLVLDSQIVFLNNSSLDITDKVKKYFH
ncbi:MAG: OmpH family outer membrane protein [Deltaproteobacteria bacterium]|nr:OmpH family outer membrane protein [Deltaproteobacteria bacterium]